MPSLGTPTIPDGLDEVWRVRDEIEVPVVLSIHVGNLVEEVSALDVMYLYQASVN